MNSGHTDSSFRAITVIAILQAAVITGGTLFVSAMLKMHGYRGGVVPDHFFQKNALFIRHSGFLLLFLPVMWVVAAVVAERSWPQSAISRVVLLLGIVAVVAGIYAYVMLGFSPAVM